MQSTAYCYQGSDSLTKRSKKAFAYINLPCILCAIMWAVNKSKITQLSILSWWRHQMETFSALLAICAGNSPVPGEFPIQSPVTPSFDVFFDLRLNKRLSKQSWGWWFEMLSCPLWRHCNVKGIILTIYTKLVAGIPHYFFNGIPSHYTFPAMITDMIKMQKCISPHTFKGLCAACCDHITCYLVHQPALTRDGLV